MLLKMITLDKMFDDNCSSYYLPRRLSTDATLRFQLLRCHAMIFLSFAVFISDKIDVDITCLRPVC